MNLFGVQVRDGDNEEWKNAYFLSYEKDTNFQFEASFFDEFTSENTLVSEVYYQCRLYKEDQFAICRKGENGDNQENTYKIDCKRVFNSF